MKKSLFALAAVGAFAGAAQAQSSVTVYGNLDIAAGQATNSTFAVGGTETKYNIRTSGNGDGALSTSVIGFRGTEDLGAGLKANFQLEYDLTDIGTGGNGNTNQTTTNGAADTTTAVNGTSTGINNGFGARQSWLSLSSSAFGELKLGRTAQSIHGVIANGLAGAGNNVAGSLYSSGSNAASETRAGIRAHNVYVNRAITYTTPTMSGVSVQLQHGSQSIDNETTAARAAVTSNSETGGSITYTGVKNLTVAYGISKLDYNTASASSTTADTKTQAQALTANYNFGPAAAFFVAQEKKVNTAAGALTNKDRAYEFGLRAPVSSAITVWASAFTGDRASDTATSKADLGGYQVGVQYAFSKRSSMYGIYGNQSIKNKEVSAASSTSKTESAGMFLGVRHSF